MKHLFLYLLSLATATGAVSDPKAAEIVARMREALGGAAKLEAVKALSAEADLRRVIPGEGGAEPRDMAGELTVDVLRPERYLKVETLSPFPGGPVFSVGTGLDGAEAWRAPLNAPSTGGHVVMRVAAPEGPAGATSLRKRTRAEMTRLLLVTLGGAGDGSLTYTYGGEAEAPEGRAHVVDVAGPEGFKARLFVDRETHRPLFVSYMGVLPRVQVRQARGERGEGERLQREAQIQAQAAQPAPEVETRLFVSEFKAVDGVLLPHVVSQSIDKGPTEEWTVKKWKVNPALKPESFRKQG